MPGTKDKADSRLQMYMTKEELPKRQNPHKHKKGVMLTKLNTTPYFIFFSVFFIYLFNSLIDYDMT